MRERGKRKEELGGCRRRKRNEKGEERKEEEINLILTLQAQLLKCCCVTDLDEATFKKAMGPSARAQLNLMGYGGQVTNLDQFLSDMYSMFHGTYQYQQQTLQATKKADAQRVPYIPPITCAGQIAVCIADAIGIVFAFIGLKAALERAVGAVITRIFTGTAKYERALTALFNQWSSATGMQRVSTCIELLMGK